MLWQSIPAGYCFNALCKCVFMRLLEKEKKNLKNLHERQPSVEDLFNNFCVKFSFIRKHNCVVCLKMMNLSRGFKECTSKCPILLVLKMLSWILLVLLSYCCSTVLLSYCSSTVYGGRRTIIKHYGVTCGYHDSSLVIFLCSYGSRGVFTVFGV